MDSTNVSRSSFKLRPRHYGIIIFTLATALLHLSLFPEMGYRPDPIVLNGFGYLGLLGAYFLAREGMHWSDSLRTEGQVDEPRQAP